MLDTSIYRPMSPTEDFSRLPSRVLVTTRGKPILYPAPLFLIVQRPSAERSEEPGASIFHYGDNL